MEEKIFEFEGLYYRAYSELDGLKKVDGKLYRTCKCSKCGGLGYIPFFGHIENGICFECYGNKYVTEKIKCYKSLKNAEKSIENDKRKEEIKKQKEIEKIWESLHNVVNDKIYIISPENANLFDKKDYLKENGCIWSGKVWYKENNFGLDNFIVKVVDIVDYVKENILHFKDLYNRYYILKGFTEFVNDITKDFASIYNTDFTDFVVGNKYDFIIDKVLVKKTINTIYGYSNFYILLDNNNRKLQYTTTKELENLHNCIATLKDIQNDTLVITRLKQVA